VIIDAHTHVGPAFIDHPPLLPGVTGDQIVEIMDRAGIDKACSFAPQWEGPHFVDPEFHQANRAVYESSKNHPERLIGFARVDPHRGPKALDEMRRCHDAYGFRGIKLHPLWEHFAADNLRLLAPILELCGDYGWPTVWHTGYYPTCQPALYMDLAEHFPEINMVLFHLSYAHTGDAIIAANRYPNIHLETAANSLATSIQEVITKVSPRQFLYGSDLPYHDPADVLAKIVKQPLLTAEARDLALGGNMARLLHMDVA
jgi:uncharacterized protein